MGFQAVKKYYDIKHIVAVYDKREFGGPCICIGSPLCHDIIVIRIVDAKLVKGYEGDNADLSRYYAAIKEDENNGILRGIIDTPDLFTRNLPVFTIKDWAVVADHCEEYGCPNTTNTVYIMYENTFSKTREEAYTFLLEDTSNGIRYCNFKYNFQQGFDRIRLAFRRLFKECWFWVATRTFGKYKTD